MAQVLQLVNGLPTMVETGDGAYDESTAYASGLAASTPITLPNSGSFTQADASDIIVEVNQKSQEVTRDFTVVGGGPTYTQIQFTYALPDDSVVRFRQLL